jgi:ABC-type transport system involved in multi-copper enzyme maturation permease subunit
MTVRDRAFHRYAGRLTPRRGRFLVLARYALREVFSSRLVTALYGLSFGPVVVMMVIIYLRHNVPALDALELDVADVVPIDAGFFRLALYIQCFAAFLLTAQVGPGLVSPDLANNGLPLYLCRPFSRAEYVLGKLTVVVGLTSTVTWVPLLLMVGLQAVVEPAWLTPHLGVVAAVLAGSWVSILLLGLLSLALSAWVRWRLLAGAMMFATIFVASGLAELVNGLFNTRYGDLLSPVKLLIAVSDGMLYGSRQVAGDPSLVLAWLGLTAFAGLCLLILNRKLQAYEVVR